MMKTYSIGEAAEELNLTVYTLRYYDKEGLMHIGVFESF